MNGFDTVQLIDIDIGPSATNVKPSGYYSNAKFVFLALNKLVKAIVSRGENPLDKSVTFSGNRELSLRDIYFNLLESMDIAFRYFVDESLDADADHALYQISLALYENESGLPDGASLYGLVMHSHNVAVLGFGNFRNDIGDGEAVSLQNMKIHDLQNSLNEIPATYFDLCDKSEEKTVLK
eukprot:326447_1